MRPTFGAWRSMSTSPMYTVHGSPTRAQAAALATPCWPAPVSATMRRAPRRRASSAWPMALLILCAPVCARSSRLSQTSRAPARSTAAAPGVSAVGRPTQSCSSRSSSAWKSGSCAASGARRARAARARESASRARSARQTGRSGRAHPESGPPAGPRAPACMFSRRFIRSSSAAPCSCRARGLHEFRDHLRDSCARAPPRRRSIHRRQRAAPPRSPPRHCPAFRPPASISSRCARQPRAACASRSPPLPLRGPSNSMRRGGQRAGPRRAQHRQPRQCRAATAALEILQVGLQHVGLEARAGSHRQCLRRMQRHRHAAHAAARRRRQRRRLPGSSCRTDGANTKPMASTPAAAPPSPPPRWSCRRS